MYFGPRCYGHALNGHFVYLTIPGKVLKVNFVCFFMRVSMGFTD